MTVTWPGLSASALARVRSLLAERQLGAVVVTTPGSVAWLGNGLNLPIDRTAGVDTVWVVVTAEAACLVTTGVEAPRLRADYLSGHPEIELIDVAWWDPEAFVAAAVSFAGAPIDRIGTDGHPAFPTDVTDDLISLRLALDEAQVATLRALGTDATAAVEDALRAWTPGERDHDVAARVAESVERAGAQAPVLLVGGDQRLAHFRHPVAVGEPMRERVMAVLVASRGGQHVALTRYATAKDDPDLTSALAPVQRMHRAVLGACRPGATTGDVLTILADGYRAEGQPDAWREHYQGGPIGYAQREFEIAPGQTGSRWWSQPLPSSCAVAWNPSLAGGAKDEDTFLVTDRGVEPITASTDWPTIDDQVPARPAPLVVGT